MRQISELMRSLAITGSMALAGLIATVSPASTNVCGTRTDLVKSLDQAFQEKRAAFGLIAEGKQLAELFVSHRGSWTLIVSLPRGKSCVIASGNDWESLPEHELGPGA